VLAEDPDEPGVLVNMQLKAVSRPTFERDWADEQVPLGYVLQTLAEGMLLDAGRSIVAALVIDTYSAELVLRDVPRHAQAEARIREVARDFWSMIARGEQPAPDYTRDGEVIARIHHAEPGKTIDLSGDNRIGEVLEQRELHRLLAKHASEAVDTLDNEIKAKLGDAEIGVLPGWKVTWKEEQRKGYTVAPSTRRPLKVTDQREKAA
jgi:predicted phage-related endonuclease